MIRTTECFGPEEIEDLVVAYQGVLAKLELTSREDTLFAAKWIICLARAGERDPIRLRDRTVEHLSPGRGSRSRRLLNFEASAQHVRKGGVGTLLLSTSTEGCHAKSHYPICE
jgi:hypothetical protein